MTTYTLYFASGETWTSDFENEEKANEHGKTLAIAYGTKYWFCEKIKETHFAIPTED